MANPLLDINDFEETNEKIGSGSFADVKLVRYKGREYAGKYFRETKGMCFDKCLSECIRSLSLEHSNIVKTVGLVMGGNEREGVAATYLVLVMEKLTVCLSQFVIQEKLLPEYVKLSILHDVTKGLQFLHSQQVMHRDLTANNILLTETLCAKISDLGQSKNLTDRDVIEAGVGQTVIPGTPLYMPPEAKRISSQFSEHNRAEYDCSIDVYSFGILMIHVYLQHFPKPKSLNGFEDKDGRGQTFRLLSPVENFKEPIDKSIPHSLCSLVCQCLDVEPRKRPSPEKLLVTVGAALNSLDSYFEKVLRYATSYIHAAASVPTVEVVGDDVTLEQNYLMVTEENKRLKMELENLKKENESLTSQLGIIRDDGWQFVKKGIDEENGLIFQTVQAFDEPQNPSILTYKQDEKKDFIDNPKKLRICSVSQPTSPIESSNLEGAKAVLINNKIFIGRRTKRIHSYDCRTKKWEALPEAPVKNYALANYQGQLVIVGGINGSTLSGSVYCYYDKKWLDCGIVPITNEDGTVENITFPSLVIPRKNAVAIGFDKCLIVLGGEVHKSGLLSVFSSADLNSVEVYYGGSNRWYKGSDLPQKGSSMQYVCADRCLFLLHPGESNVVYCSLDQLVTTSTTGSICEVWHTVKNHRVNFNYSSLAVYNKTLLTLAGDGSDGHVYAYKPNENKRPWRNVECKPSLPAIKNACCLQISQHELFLCGGDFGIMPNQAFQVGYLLTVEESSVDDESGKTSSAGHKISLGKKKQPLVNSLH